MKEGEGGREIERNRKSERERERGRDKNGRLFYTVASTFFKEFGKEVMFDGVVSGMDVG